MKGLAVAVCMLSTYRVAHAQSTPDTSPVERRVRGTTIVSARMPAADLIVGDGFRYVASQVVNLFGKAEAEQHVFVRGPGSGAVDAFYWVQFEHLLPTNTSQYNYRPARTTTIGGLEFIYDVAAYPDYSVSGTDSRSDHAAIVRLLAQHHLAMPTRVARVRMFHLPSPERRAELMIIYGERVADDSRIPMAEPGVQLDSASPSVATLLLKRALHGITIKPH